MQDVMIYYAQGGQQCGPVTLQQLLTLGLAPGTLVWYEGLESWTAASEAPYTAPYFRHAAPPPPPGYGGGGSQNAYDGQQRYQGGYNNREQRQQPRRRPDDYLVWSILVTILCCLPFGIVAIVYSSKVNSLWAEGRYEEAYDSQRKAKNWCLAGAISGAAFVLLYFIGVMSVPLAFL